MIALSTGQLERIPLDELIIGPTDKFASSPETIVFNDTKDAKIVRSAAKRMLHGFNAQTFADLRQILCAHEVKDSLNGLDRF